MVDRCRHPVHVEGELDERIVGFYERLRARFPDYPPNSDSDDCPWMSMPLDVGIDHVFMCLSFSERSDPAITLITELATEYGLTLWDPQDGSAHKPVEAPLRQEVTAWWRDLLDGRRSREETFERVRTWVEEPPVAIDDPITLMGLQQLHGLGLTAERRAGHLHEDREIRALFEQWLTHGTRFDADPAGWQRDRYRQALETVLRDQGQQHAQTLAKRMVAADWLPAEEVARILGSTTGLLDDERVEILELLQPGLTKPHVDHAARASWLAAVHEAMRSVGGAVVAAAEEPVAGRNYYRVSVEARDGVGRVIVFNSAARLVAAAEAADPQEIALVFAAVPGGGVFSERGFQVAGPAQLNEPLDERHLHALAADERRDVTYHRPSRLGDLLFNWFD